MTMRYVGTRDQNWGSVKHRAVELGCREEEQVVFDRVCNLMRIKGWKIDNGVECWGLCLVEDRKEAYDFALDWKESKKCVLNCVKYGF